MWQPFLRFLLKNYIVCRHVLSFTSTLTVWRILYLCIMTGTHHQEPATAPYSWHGVFTDRATFSLNLSRIQIPIGTSVANCNHKHGLIVWSVKLPLYWLYIMGVASSYINGLLSQSKIEGF